MLWPFVLYFVLVVLLVAAMLALSWVLGQRHREHGTDLPYEGGIVSEGSARVRITARFYLIAVFFVVFDLEAAFLFSWAVAARDLGWTAYWEAAVFTLVLFGALFYLARTGALNWSSGNGRRGSS